MQNRTKKFNFGRAGPKNAETDKNVRKTTAQAKSNDVLHHCPHNTKKGRTPITGTISRQKSAKQAKMSAEATQRHKTSPEQYIGEKLVAGFGPYGYSPRFEGPTTAEFVAAIQSLMKEEIARLI